MFFFVVFFLILFYFFKKPVNITTPGTQPAPTRVDKGKKKQKPIISPKFVADSDSGSKADDKPDTKADGKPAKKVSGKPVPKAAPQPPTPATTLGPTDHMQEWDPKCDRCETGNHACHVNPNSKSHNPACFECATWKVRCSLASGSATRKEENDGTKADATKAEGSKKPSRKKPTAVPAGGPGQSAGEFFFA
jgi:hypothetical protein